MIFLDNVKSEQSCVAHKSNVLRKNKLIRTKEKLIDLDYVADYVRDYVDQSSSVKIVLR